MRQSDGGPVSEANKPLRALLIELAWRSIRYVPRAYPIDLLKKVVAEAPGRSGIVSDTIAGETIRLGVDERTGAIRVIDAPDQAQVVHTFWFARAAFHPGTQLFVPAR